MNRWLLTLLTAIVLPLNLAAAEIRPFTAHYDVRFSGLAGEWVTTLSREADGLYVLENRVSTKGFASLIRPGDALDRSVFRIEDDNLRPISFVSDDGTRKNKRGSSITFDWSARRASAEYQGETRTLELENGTIDRQLMQIAMMTDLADGLTEVSYTVIDRDAIKTYTVTVVGRETIEVPAGTFEAIRIERKKPGSSRSSIFWCAPELDYLTVRMEQLKNDKTIGTMVLTEIG